VASAIEEHQRGLSIRNTTVLGGAVYDRGVLLQCVSGAPVPFANGVVGARLAPEDADERIDEVVETFVRHAVPGIWWVGPNAEPADLPRRLERRGFVHQEAMPWLAADLHEAPRGGAPAHRGLHVERVRDTRADAAWLQAMTEGFGLTDPARDLLGELSTRSGYDPTGAWVRFVGMLDGRPVGSSGLSMTGGGVAGIYNVATVPAERRHGVGHAMSRAAMLHARRLGFRVAVLGTSSMARSLYTRLGFREVCVLHLYAWEPPARGRALPVSSSSR
jgi:ribosomal protein S18 acetylase RimI-like enzyme